MAREQAQRAEEPLGRVAIAALGLHRLDDHAEVLAGRERLVHRGERRDLGGEQRIVLGVAEPLAAARRCRRSPPRRRSPLGAVGSSPGVLPHRERRERRTGSRRARTARACSASASRAARAACGRGSCPRTRAPCVASGRAQLMPAQRHRLLVGLGARRDERDVRQARARAGAASSRSRPRPRSRRPRCRRCATSVSPNSPSMYARTTGSSANPPTTVAVWLMPSSTASGSASIETIHGPAERR